VKRFLSHSSVSTPLALALLGLTLSLLTAQPAMADKRVPISSGTESQQYWCAGTAGSAFSDAYSDPSIPSEVGWSGDDANPVAPLTTNDGYKIQLNYWNSVLSGAPNASQGGNGGSSSKGYSTGVSCIAADTGSGDYKFKVVFPPDPSKPEQAEMDRAQAKPTSPPWYGEWPYRWGQNLIHPPYDTTANVAGGPGGYPSIWLGCSWGDSTTCTPDSSLPWSGDDFKDTNPRILPRQLKHITSLPSSWEIDYAASAKQADPKFGVNPVWDAAFDIWFDKTGDPNVGKSPFNPQIRGQNDGLEIMVWMDCNRCQPQKQPATADGYVTPIGWWRENVRINGVEYIVWSGRLNNPNYGYSGEGSTIIAANESADSCSKLATVTDRNDPAGDSKMCGTNWNVVSFMATTATQSKRMDMDAKVFADYILGKGQVGSGMCSDPNVANNALWCWTSKQPNSRMPDGVLACPGSPLLKQWQDGMGSDAAANGPKLPIDCLSEDWVLTSVQAGFETWVNAQSLTTKNFKSYALVTSSAVQSGHTADDPPAKPVVYWGAPFNVVYNGCSTVDPNNNSASFQIELLNPPADVSKYWPASDDGSAYQAMGTQQSNGQFVFTVPSLAPMHSEAIIHFKSSCGPDQDVAIYIDPSGRIVYADGTTPVVGAKVTLGYSSDGINPPPPFPPVPNHNEGISPVMQPNDNTQNPMSTDKYGSYAWNVIPGFYQVKAEKEGCGSVTSSIQHVVDAPIMGLDLVLPCPPPQTPGGNLNTTLTITSNWTTGGPSGKGGYCATVNGTNNTGAALDWTAAFALPEAGAIYDNWNGNFAQSENAVTVSGIAWNNILQPGQSLNSVGFCVNRGASVPVPPPTMKTLSVTKAGAGSGTVTSSPAGINCGSTCSVNFANGTSVTLAATPASGSVFAGWSGACSGTGACTIAMNAAQSVTATFNLGTGGVTVTPVINQNTTYFTEEDLKISNTGSLTALTITMTIQKTTGISYNGQYNTVGTQIQQSHNAASSPITYTFKLASGQTLGAGSNRLFAAQANGTGTAHPTSGDTYTVTYTTGGATYTQTGHF